MTLTIDPSCLEDLDISSEDVRIDLAIGLYASRRITLGRAAKIAGLDQVSFQKRLQYVGVPLHYDESDWAEDLRIVREKA